MLFIPLSVNNKVNGIKAPMRVGKMRRKNFFSSFQKTVKVAISCRLLLCIIITEQIFVRIFLKSPIDGIIQNKLKFHESKMT
ncbi:CLUMA_CG004329, isoform A [Clunio marinus]|uniref:CLUMA_CG004329, isoform A n=1 Tax=Clunio marinus TaxID=568069 RepID=A0A1J1HRM0_9DIPT|nr:CLUMA_CG004329, isoform A [Clunio marinus]